MNDIVTITELNRLDIRIGKIIEAEIVEGSDKLIKTIVDFGEEIGTRQIVSGIKDWYGPADLIGKILPYIINLEPKKIMGMESQGMLLSVAPVDEDGKKTAVLLAPVEDVKPGTKVV